MADNEEVETKNDSQAFSDWGESFTDEVTRIEEVEVENTSPATNSQHNFNPEPRPSTSTYSESSVRAALVSKFIDDGKSPRLEKSYKGGKGSSTVFDSDENGVVSFQSNHSHKNHRDKPRSTINGADDVNGAENQLNDTFDYLRQVQDNKNFNSASGQAIQGTPSSNDYAQSQSGLDCQSTFTDSDYNIVDQPTQLYRQQISDSESDHDESIVLTSDTWNTPPPQSSVSSEVTRTPRRSSMQVAGTPKREATSPMRSQKTPAKQQKLPAAVENSVWITPVRDVFENLSTK